MSNDAFLTNPEILSIFIEESSQNCTNCLPQSLIDFWKNFLILLQEKNILVTLFLQLLELIKVETNTNRKLLASLWVKTIAQSFTKLKIAKSIRNTLEQELDQSSSQLDPIKFDEILREKVNKCYPELACIPLLNIDGDFPNCLRNREFVERLVLNFYEFSEHYIPDILKMSSFLENDSKAKEELINLMKIHSLSNESKETEQTNKIYTIEDLQKNEPSKETPKKNGKKKEFFDSKIRNRNWKIEKGKFFICIFLRHNFY